MVLQKFSEPSESMNLVRMRSLVCYHDKHAKNNSWVSKTHICERVEKTTVVMKIFQNIDKWEVIDIRDNYLISKIFHPIINKTIHIYVKFWETYTKMLLLVVPEKLVPKKLVHFVL